jgi:hypothetical protein
MPIMHDPGFHICLLLPQLGLFGALSKRGVGPYLDLVEFLETQANRS